MLKRGLQLDRVVLLGRTFEEYCHFFAISPEELRGKRVLDVASGVSSFAAEAAAAGIHVVAADPIYTMTEDEIAARCGPDLDYVHDAIQHLSTYRWNWYKSPQRMRTLREQASTRFLADYQNARNGRYVAASLPRLPFADGEFDLCLVSYFLFAYQDQLPYEFHRDSILELLRVTRGEARLYPTVTFEAEKSAYLDQLRRDPAFGRVRFEEVPTDFEFLANSNSFLRVRRAEIHP